jgi:ligand-binding sensor domain-containing protein
VLTDRNDASRLYVGIVNDKELGGFFTSDDAGKEWKLWNKGLNERDVLALGQARSGVIFAGTNHGIFSLKSLNTAWEPANMYHGALPEWRKKDEPSQSSSKSKTASARSRSVRSKSGTSKTAAIKAESLHETPIPIAIAPRVRSLLVTDSMWYAATNEGLFISEDQGKKWYGEAVLSQKDLIGVQQIDANTVAVVSPTQASVSHDAGKTWVPLTLPSYVTVVYGLTSAPDRALWLSTREGALHSADQGKSWEHMLGGLPAREILSVHYDAGSQRLLATGLHTRTVFESKDDGKSWQPLPASIVSIRAAMTYQGRILAATSHNGLLLEKSGQVASAVKDTGEASAGTLSRKQ